MSDRFGSIAISPDKKVPTLKETESPSPRRPGPPKKQKEKQRGALLFALGTFLLFTFYFLAGVYLAPGLLQKYLPHYLYEKTGLELELETIQFNPLNFQLTVKEIQARLPESGASTPLLQAESLFMDLDLTSLLRNGFVCDSLKIEGLQLNLIRFKDKSYNLPPPLSPLQRTENGRDHGFCPVAFSLFLKQYRHQ